MLNFKLNHAAAVETLAVAILEEQECGFLILDKYNPLVSFLPGIVNHELYNGPALAFFELYDHGDGDGLDVKACLDEARAWAWDLLDSFDLPAGYTWVYSDK